MWNETNPTSLYLGTTWELISAGKYVQTGSTALATGGSNSITIVKANLPNIKLNTTSATASINPHFHATGIGLQGMDGTYGSYDTSGNGRGWTGDAYTGKKYNWKTSTDGGGVTGTFSLQTEVLGSGTPITIQPNYITLKFWKRTS